MASSPCRSKRPRWPAAIAHPLVDPRMVVRIAFATGLLPRQNPTCRNRPAQWRKPADRGHLVIDGRQGIAGASAIRGPWLASPWQPPDLPDRTDAREILWFVRRPPTPHGFDEIAIAAPQDRTRASPRQHLKPARQRDCAEAACVFGSPMNHRPRRSDDSSSQFRKSRARLSTLA